MDQISHFLSVCYFNIGNIDLAFVVWVESDFEGDWAGPSDDWGDAAVGVAVGLVDATDGVVDHESAGETPLGLVGGDLAGLAVGLEVGHVAVLVNEVCD